MTAVRAAFPDHDLAAILAVVDRYGAASHERERERVQLAIVELSEGRMEKLQYLVQAAKTDYRDVLAWKQLGPLPTAEGEKLRNGAGELLKKWGKP